LSRFDGTYYVGRDAAMTEASYKKDRYKGVAKVYHKNGKLWIERKQFQNFKNSSRV